MNSDDDTRDLAQLAQKIKHLGRELGFDQIGITDTNLEQEFCHFQTWLQAANHGDMKYFEKYSDLYAHPQALLPDTTRIICCAIRYPQPNQSSSHIAAFATIQDYSRHIRELLKTLVEKISHSINTEHLLKTRIFAGNAPILEKALAAKAGIGWYGKNSLILNRNLGSYFFLGEILINMPLPIDTPITASCGNCSKCIDNCPAKAITAPYHLNTNHCISYLTIEHKGPIPLELRPLIGTKIFGCDHCQQVCPWNQHKKTTTIQSTLFTPLPNFDSENLLKWFLWSESEFLENTKDSPIHRLGHERWLRNIAVALGNLGTATKDKKIYQTLHLHLNHPSLLVREHVNWAIQRTSPTIPANKR